MDAHKTGAFIAALRKERGMTQAALAKQLHVTDKAVSRWERGAGLPDIQTFEPLAQALGITLLELMHAERQAPRPITETQANAALRDTLHTARQQWKRKTKRVLLALLGAAAIPTALVCAWLLISGSFARTDVFMADYTYMESNVITLRVGLAGSMGYVRSWRNVSDDPAVMQLQFYSAYGGFNSKLGARNVFLLQPAEECTEICIHCSDGAYPILRKDALTGQWLPAKAGSEQK